MLDATKGKTPHVFAFVRNELPNAAEGFVNLSRLRQKDGRKKRFSESVGRISGDFGDFASRNESRRELFAIE